MNKSALLVLAASLALGSLTSQTRASTPNLLIIMTDDQGYADVGFHGSPDIRTPNLDRLAANGLVFENGYVCHPVCGPSRTGLMTGRYPHRFGLQENIPFSKTDQRWGVPLDQRFLSEDLQEGGYRTGILGKWHLGATDDYHPNNRGFDYFFGFLGGGHNFWPAEYAENRAWQFQNARKETPTVPPNPEALSYSLPLLRNREYVEETDYLTDVLTREAVDFIDRNKAQPFFLYLAYNAPHKPLEAKPEDLALFDHIPNKDRRIYAAMIYAVDRGVGRIRAKLEQENLLGNTVIVFLSDNGGISDKHAIASNAPLRGQKGDALEGGYHVPFVIHWPENIRPGQTQEIISSLDLYPTFLSAAGLRVPDGRDLEGVNQLPFLRGDTASSPRDGVFMRRELGRFHAVGVRSGVWKYYRDTREDDSGLYNLETDLAEQHDLSAQYPEKLQELIQRHDTWNASNRVPEWDNPGWHWQQNPEHARQVVLSFEKEMAAHDRAQEGK